MPACGEGCGEDFPQGKLGRSILADGVGLLGDVRNPRPFQQHRVGKRLDTGLRDAELFCDVGSGGTRANACLNLVGAQTDGLRRGGRSLCLLRLMRGGHDGVKASGVHLCGFLRLGSVYLRPSVRLMRVLDCCTIRWGICGLWGVCGAGGTGRREQLTKLVGDFKEELLAVLCPEDERGVS